MAKKAIVLFIWQPRTRNCSSFRASRRSVLRLRGEELLQAAHPEGLQRVCGGLRLQGLAFSRRRGKAWGYSCRRRAAGTIRPSFRRLRGESSRGGTPSPAAVSREGSAASAAGVAPLNVGPEEFVDAPSPALASGVAERLEPPLRGIPLRRARESREQVLVNVQGPSAARPSANSDSARQKRADEKGGALRILFREPPESRERGAEVAEHIIGPGCADILFQNDMGFPDSGPSRFRLPSWHRKLCLS